MNKFTNTISQIDTFLDDIREKFIFHIPHSSEFIPDFQGFNKELIENETKLLVDHATDKIFNIEGVDSVIFPYNRIFCDVERLPDEKEELFKLGRGFYYTKTDDGKTLRELNEEHKNLIKKNYYDTHHKILNDLIENKIKKFQIVYIIDCHSYSDIPFISDLDKNSNRPDICLGTDVIHTPKWLIDKIKHTFEKEGLSVKINTPYSGTIVPLKFYGNNQIKSIMIEINRKLYIDNDGINSEKINYLNNIIKKSLFYG
jgi:N-formylglutamate deformylase